LIAGRDGVVAATIRSKGSAEESMAVSEDVIASDRRRVAVGATPAPLPLLPDLGVGNRKKRARPGGRRAFDPEALQRAFNALKIEFDSDQRSLWCIQNHADRACYTPTLLEQILGLQAWLSHCSFDAPDSEAAPRSLIWASNTEGVFNLGGDLELFVRLIRERDEEGLRRYAHLCVDSVYNNLTNVGLPLLNITLVQGDALGGGFEAALSSDVIIAERQSQFGLPEILFNLFPGMGAYSLLCRRLDGARAKEMILSGRLYGAEELYEMGVVDVLAEPGDGRIAARRYIDENQRRHRTLVALGDVRRRCQPISYEELIDVTNLWVETALGLCEMDLRRMARLASAQRRRCGRLSRSAPDAAAAR
jgi:DSF synthase